MDVLGDAIERSRRSDDVALRAAASGREYDYRRFCTSAWKAGNFLRHLGVRSGARVAVADDPVPEAVLTLYGTALLGGVVRFDPPSEPDEDLRALVVPTADLDAHEVGPSTKRVAYGSRPDDPSVSYFERDVWSENPTEPPDRIAATDPLVETPRATYSHGRLLETASSVVDRFDLEAGDEVAVAGSFTDPAVVAAGLLAPIVAGAVVVVGPGADGDIVVGGPDSDVDSARLLADGR